MPHIFSMSFSRSLYFERIDTHVNELTSPLFLVLQYYLLLSLLLLTNIYKVKNSLKVVKRKNPNVFGVKPSSGQFDRPRDCAFMSIR